MGNSPIFFDAGMFIGALLRDDLRHAEARPIVKAAYYGELPACTSTGVLSEVYVHLTNERAVPQHSPEEAASAITKLVAPPSKITVVPEQGLATVTLMLLIAQTAGLRSRNFHDARHAATALGAGATDVYTYNVADWLRFKTFGINVSGPASILTRETPKR